MISSMNVCCIRVNSGGMRKMRRYSTVYYLGPIRIVESLSI